MINKPVVSETLLEQTTISWDLQSARPRHPYQTAETLPLFICNCDIEDSSDDQACPGQALARVGTRDYAAEWP